jgi:hypothetical protein
VGAAPGRLHADSSSDRASRLRIVFFIVIYGLVLR